MHVDYHFPCTLLHKHLLQSVLTFDHSREFSASTLLGDSDG
ncbi:hypothetical protein [Pseudomonas sp. PS01297]|nr:hypothetical protein [Pseudomonas sp. PS01297]